jgi:HSP20 family protein
MAQLSVWDPFRTLARMREDMDRLTSGWSGGITPETTFAGGVWAPPVNIAETDDSYSITADLPGLSKDDIKVTYQNGVLTIQGERKEEKEENNKKNWHRMERVYGMFERSFRLPMPVKAEQVQAEFKDGVLKLTVPKAEEAKPKQIEVKVR